MKTRFIFNYTFGRRHTG